MVARSQEAKDLGIAMGVPMFKIKPKIEKHSIEVYSSNYVLYGDMSARVMAATLFHFSPEVEIYSIDEAFIDLSWISDVELRKYAISIRRTIMMCTGIPVSVGIAPTKALAKIANRAAKKQPQHHGVFIYPQSDSEQQNILKAIATHTTTASAKLRKQKQNTTAITIFILTSRFKDNYCSNSITLALPISLNSTPELINAALALRGLELIYRHGYEYKKAGITCQGLVSENIRQGNVFLQNYD